MFVGSRRLTRVPLPKITRFVWISWPEGDVLWISTAGFAGLGLQKESSCGLPMLRPMQPVAARLWQVLKYIEPERVQVTPDCGFSQTARYIARGKLANMVEGVRFVRKELGQ